MPAEDHLLNTIQDQENSLSASARITQTKKQGVSGQSIAANHDIKIEVFQKDFRAKTMIKEAIMENDYMKNLSPPQVRFYFLLDLYLIQLNHELLLRRSRISWRPCRRGEFPRAVTS